MNLDDEDDSSVIGFVIVALIVAAFIAGWFFARR